MQSFHQEKRKLSRNCHTFSKDRWRAIGLSHVKIRRIEGGGYRTGYGHRF